MTPRNLEWLAILLLCACNDAQDSLTEYVKRTEQQAQYEVTELQPEPRFRVFRYIREQRRSPFALPEKSTSRSLNPDCATGEPGTQSAILEEYSIGQLRFTGVMRRGDSVEALILTPEGTLNVIQSGQYLAQEQARVVRITDDSVLIRQWLVGPAGCREPQDFDWVLQ